MVGEKGRLLKFGTLIISNILQEIFFIIIIIIIIIIINN